MAINEMSRLHGMLLADIKAREDISEIKNFTKEQYNYLNNELNSILTRINNLSKVATSGSYHDLTNIPNMPTFDKLLTSISGFDPSKTQILKNINGTLTWVDE